MNSYIQENKEEYDLLTVDESVREDQISKLRQIKMKRDNDAVAKALKELEVAASGNTNLFPLILEAVRLRATIGEISESLRKVWGKYQAPITI